MTVLLSNRVPSPNYWCYLRTYCRNQLEAVATFQGPDLPKTFSCCKPGSLIHTRKSTIFRWRLKEGIDSAWPNTVQLSPVSVIDLISSTSTKTQFKKATVPANLFSVQGPELHSVTKGSFIDIDISPTLKKWRKVYSFVNWSPYRLTFTLSQE